jgi:hypothetical protein
MPSFASELNAAWRKRATELGRDPTQEEGEVIEAELVEAWISAQRFDELITRFLSEYGREGGNLDLIILGHALRQRKDAARIHKLFRSVVNNRGQTTIIFPSGGSARENSLHGQAALNWLSREVRGSHSNTQNQWWSAPYCPVRVRPGDQRRTRRTGNGTGQTAPMLFIPTPTTTTG